MNISPTQSPSRWEEIRGGGTPELAGGETPTSGVEHPPPAPIPALAKAGVREGRDFVAQATLRLAGYAALFSIADGARDTIVPGAFTVTLAERDAPLPLYWQHRPDQRIGWVDSMAEDTRGLRVIARIDNPDSRAAHLLGQRAVNGLSFGYRARAFRHTDQGRELHDIDLFEISLVTHPLQHGARVHWAG